VSDDIFERLGIANSGQDVGWGDGPDEGEEALGICRWMVSVVSDHCQHPAFIVLGEGSQGLLGLGVR
jgi:hypothetical protein